jgi:hypothetical protein
MGSQRTGTRESLPTSIAQGPNGSGPGDIGTGSFNALPLTHPGEPSLPVQAYSEQTMRSSTLQRLTITSAALAASCLSVTLQQARACLPACPRGE